MPLEPRLVLLMKSPTLALQRFGGKVLLICTLAVVEYEEESIGIDLWVDAWILDDVCRVLWVVWMCSVFVRRSVVPRFLSVISVWRGLMRCSE